MMTIAVISLLVGLFFTSGLLWVLCLRLGLRWAKVPGLTWRTVVLTAILVFALQLVFTVGSLSLQAMISQAPTFAVMLVELAAAIVVPCGVVIWIFKTTLVQALKAWLVTLLSGFVMLALTLLIVRPFLFEAFSIPTNSMAPTILGRHWRGTCEECGSPAFSSPLPDDAYAFIEAPLMICRDHFHITRPTERDDEVFSGDRVLVAKFVRPQRWDLVVFDYPEDRRQQYVKRLVGLPGETITIDNGQIRANGKLLTLPDSLRELHYQSEIRGFAPLWGSPEAPAKLGDDEYFVLGDFTEQAKDSRLWQQGAPGHPPYAVPDSYLNGVVTHIYWPPSHWRTFR